MKRCASALLVALVLLAAGLPAARAASLSGRASSQVLWFGDEFDRDHFVLAQYLRFTAQKLDAGNSLSATGYGRAWGDVQQGGGVEGRLYYLYIDKKTASPRIDFRVGRQFFFVSAGSAIVDGARIDARPFGPLALTVVGGRHVLFNETGEDTRKGDVAGAVQVGLTNIRDGSANLSYFLSYDENDLAREGLGLAAAKRFSKYGELYTQLRFDLLSEVWSEIQAGARSAWFPRLTLAAEYFRSIPVFDASSIYAVFAVDRFQEVMFRADYAVHPRLSVRGEYRNESYGGGDTANVGEAGVILKPRDGMSLYGAAIWRNGTGGRLLGFELSGDAVYRKDFLFSAGVQHDVSRRDLMTGNESASRFWAGGDWKFRKNFSASARLENNINENFDHDVRARLALNVDF